MTHHVMAPQVTARVVANIRTWNLTSATHGLHASAYGFVIGRYMPVQHLGLFSIEDSFDIDNSING
jgi:hypothetical protein